MGEKGLCQTQQEFTISNAGHNSLQSHLWGIVGRKYLKTVSPIC